MSAWPRGAGVLVAACVLASSAATAAAPAVSWADPAKTLRVALPTAETGLDPAASGDLYSNVVISALFDTLYEWDYLALPRRVVPRAAASLPEISVDGLVWTIRLRQGIRFIDDPAFGGKPRELTAADVVYSWKRIVDPRTRSPNVFLLRGKLVGLDEAVAAAKEKGRFDYDAQIEGLRAVDRYTVRLELTEPGYALLPQLASTQLAVVAREAIEKYGDASGWAQANPVGSGPFRLSQWRRGQKIVLEANRDYRPETFPAAPTEADAVTRGAAAAMRGKRLPQVGRVEIAVIEESNPRLLAFDGGEIDVVDVPRDLVQRVLDDSGMLQKRYADAGVALHRATEAALGWYALFNMRDPVVGGYTPEKVALRRAVLSAYDVPGEIRVALQGQATPATQLVPPGVAGHDPAVKAGTPFDPGLARSLLDKFGYVDRDGDGFRELPDGRPLTLQMGSATTGEDRIRDELWQKSLRDIGVRVEFVKQKWPDLLKMSRAGTLQMWQVSYTGTDGDLYMQLAYTPNENNLSFFSSDEFDRLYLQSRRLPPGPERDHLYARLSSIVSAYAPFGAAVYRIENTLVQPWVRGYVKNPFRGQSWRFLDVDPARRKASR